MSKVAELAYDIEQLYIDGMSARMIALTLECPVEMVLNALQEMSVEDVAEVPQDEEIYSPYYGA
jgi:DNA-directed RNA polymerase specialized sigma24 family protein